MGRAPLDTSATASIATGALEAESVHLGEDAQVGKYTILRLLGAGGMGVVYLAMDTVLFRPVALKLIVADRADPDRDRARVEREAQALARLNSPNVVAVYDVGAHGDHLYLAMEFVDGGTLRAWLEAQPRAADEVVATVAAAGRGLAAAHAEGLVHRDFKLDNILVARDGRVVVTDFGIAVRAAGDYLAVGTGRADAARAARPPSVVGTPGYVAPEAFRGAPPDPRADQFSFAVTLYRALYGRLPFAAGRLRIDQPPPLLPRTGVHGRVRRRVRGALARALAVLPARRFPDVAALLVAIAPRSRSPWPRITIGIGALALALVAAVAIQPPPPALATACDAASDGLAVSWNPDVAGQLEAAFRATDLPYAATTFATVRARLDGYRDQWRREALDACRDRAAGVQSVAAYEDRRACLDVDARRLRTVVAALKAPDRVTLASAVTATGLLPDPARCADPAPGRTPMPIDPQLRARIHELRGVIAEVAGLVDVGRRGAAAARLQVIVPEVDVLDYRPLSAERHLVEADLLVDQGERRQAALEQALWAAEASGDDALAARAAIQLVESSGYQRARMDEADVYRRHAEALLTRMGEPPALRRALDLATANVLFRDGRIDDAEAHAVRAARGGLPYEAVAAHVRIGAILRQRGRYAAAEGEYRVAEAIATAAYGAGHPDLAGVHNNIGSLNLSRDDLEAAAPHLRTALDILTSAFGPTARQRALPLANLGDLARRRGRTDLARDQFAAAALVLGPRDPLRPTVLARLGSARCQLGLVREGRALVAEVLAALPARSPGDHVVRSRVLQELAICHRAAGARAATIETLTRAVADARVASDRDVRARALIALAEVVMRRDPAQARQLLAELATMAATGDLPGEVVERSRRLRDPR